MNRSYYATVLLQELLGQPSLLCMVTLMLTMLNGTSCPVLDP